MRQKHSGEPHVVRARGVQGGGREQINGRCPRDCGTVGARLRGDSIGESQIHPSHGSRGSFGGTRSRVPSARRSAQRTLPLPSPRRHCATRLAEHQGGSGACGCGRLSVTWWARGWSLKLARCCHLPMRWIRRKLLGSFGREGAMATAWERASLPSTCPTLVDARCPAAVCTPHPQHLLNSPEKGAPPRGTFYRHQPVDDCSAASKSYPPAPTPPFLRQRLLHFPPASPPPYRFAVHLVL